MKTVVLLILMNLPNGEQHIMSRSAPMDMAACDVLQHAVWAVPDASNPLAYIDQRGPVQRYDAACVSE